MRLVIESPPFVSDEKIKPYLESVFSGEYEIPLHYAKEPPIVLDLGANYGSFSVWASHRWPGAEIHAYEPHPKTFVTLEENLGLYPKVHAHNYAIGRPGIRLLTNGVSNSGESSLYLQEGQTDVTGQHVEVRSPIELPEAHIIKMDTEGAEVEILEPLIEDGRKFDAVMFEYHRAGDRRKLDDLLSDYILTGAYIYSPKRGVLRYLRKDLIP